MYEYDEKGQRCAMIHTSTNTLSVVALPQQTVDTADGESETSLGRAAMM